MALHPVANTLVLIVWLAVRKHLKLTMLTKGHSINEHAPENLHRVLIFMVLK
jgi:hypothetical protein